MKHLLTLLLLTACSTLSAQNEQFPGVEVIVNLIRPSVYPEDVSQPGAATISLRLAADRPEYNGYLVLQLRDDAGRIFTSRNDRSTPIIRFTPTQRVIVLTGNMLQPWVEQLVDQNGPNGGNGILTEGTIFLRAWMVDFNFTDEIVSNEAQGMNFAEIHEPPTPMAPVGEQTANDISLLNFRWLANHVGSSPIKYSISVWELPDIWAQSPDVVLSTFPLIAPPVEVPGVNLTSYPWTNANSLLEEGKTYIYTIRAEDLTGRMRFRNNGISPYRIFTYTERINPLDMLCYSPEDLEIEGNNELRWFGEDFDDVSYTVIVREQPSNRFVSFTELEPTPTFPERTTINGGPGVRYTYRLPTALDTTDGRAFTVQLCAVCPNTGEQNCRELAYGTPRNGTGPGTEIDEEVATSGEEITLDEEGGEAGAEVLCFDLREPTLTLVNAVITSTEVSWDFSGYLLDEPLKLRWQPTNGGLPDSLSVAKTGSQQTITGLLGNTSYDLTLCAPCGNGDICRNLTFQTENYLCPTEADLLAGVLIEARPPDAVYVNWSGALGDVNPLNWWSFINDGGAADEQRTPAGSTSGAPAPAPETLFEGLKNDTLYVVTVCHRCSNGTIVCADFETEIPGCESFDIDPQIAGVGFDTARISWTATSGGEYSISYVSSRSDSPPTVVTSDQPVKTLGDLRPSTTYEVTVCAPCGGIDICETLTLTTTAVSCAQAGEYVYEYECGTQGEIDEFETDELVTDLSPGDSIWAGDFLIEVGEITGAGPAFGGYGFAEVPYLNGAKLRLDFLEVKVNENCRMVSGEMVVKSPVRSILETIDNTVNDFIDLVNNVDQFLAQMQEALALFGDLVNELAGQVDQWDQLNEVLDAATGAVTQIPFIPQNLLNDLEVAASCMRQAAANPDAPGAEAQMEDCNEAFQEALANVQAYVDALFDAPFIVDFAPQDGQSVTYGMDGFRYEAITENYVVHTIKDEEYPVQWISTSTTAGREGNALIARRRDGGAMSEVTFIGTDQATIPGWTPSGATASHPGLDAGGDQRVRHVFASIPGDTTGGKPPVRLAGQVSLVTYDPVEVTVHIVPVNNAAVPFSAADAADLQARMNVIYHPAVVDLTVVIQASLSAPAFNDTIARVDRHPLSNYTPAMVDLRGLVKDQSYHNGQDYYLLVVKAMTPAGRDGVMPRKRRYGFLSGSAFANTDGSPITSPDAKTRFARLAAHELGHGAFHLQHTFDRFEQAFENTTDNLMDYTGQEALYRYQWGNVHDPEANFTLFDEEGEGESNTLDNMAFLERLANDDGTYTFISPAGKPITLPPNVQSVTFNTGDNVKEVDRCGIGFSLYPFGSLRSFKLKNGITYYTYFRCNESAAFAGYGYKSSDTIKYYRDVLSKDLSENESQAIYVIPKPVNGTLGWVARKAPWSYFSFTSPGELSAGNYLASGSRKEFDSYAEPPENMTEIEIVLENNTTFSQPAEDLLTLATAWTASTSKSLMYAYTHAHQMSMYPTAGGYCGISELTGINYDRYLEALASIYENNARIRENPSRSDYGGIRGNPEGLMSRLEIKAWEAADASIYRRYHEFTETTISTRDILNVPDTKLGAEQLVDILSVWKDYPCALSVLSLAERKHILKVLRFAELNNQWLWGVFGEENQGLYNTVLSFTTETEYNEILPIFYNNNYEVYDSVYSNFDDNAYDVFVGELSVMATQVRNFRVRENSTRSEVQIFPLGNQQGSVTVFVSQLYADLPSSEEQNFIHTVNNEVDDPGRYHSSAIGRNNAGLMTIRLSNGEYAEARTAWSSRGRPFDPVQLRFEHDVVFGQGTPSAISVKAGEVLIIPFCLAELLFRKYRDAAWDKNFKGVIVFAAIAGAIATFAPSGGSSVPVLFKAVAVADAAAASAVFVLSEDDYQWKTTGNGSIPREIHDEVARFSQMVGIASLVTIAPGGIEFIFNVLNIKKSWKAVKEFPERAEIFKTRLNSLNRLIKRQLAAADNNVNLIRLERQMEAEIIAMRLNDKALLLGENSLHLEASLYSFVLRNGSARTPLGGGQVIDGVYHMRPAAWADVPPSEANALLTLNGVHYIDNAGDARFGDLRFYQDPDNPRIWRCLGDIRLIPFADEYNDFYNLFVRQQWNWTDDFTENTRQYLNTLNLQERRNLLNSFDQWDSANGQDFRKIFDDLAEGLYPTGLNSSRSYLIVTDVANDALENAIDASIKFTGDPAMILLKDRFSKIRQEVMRRTISYEDLVNREILLRRDLLTSLPINVVSQRGLGPDILSEVKDLLANDETLEALVMLSTRTKNEAVYRETINLQGQLSALRQRVMQGTVSYSNDLLTSAIIRKKVLDLLPGQQLVDQGFTRTGLEMLFGKLNIGYIDNAIQDAGQISTNLVLRQNDRMARDLYQRWRDGIIAPLQHEVGRNKIMRELVDNLPVSFSPGDGIDASSLDALRSLAASDLSEATTIVINQTNNLDTYKNAIQLKGRINNLQANRSLYDAESINIIESRQLYAFLTLLKRGETALPSVITPESIKIMISEGMLARPLAATERLVNQADFAVVRNRYKLYEQNMIDGKLTPTEMILETDNITVQLIQQLDIIPIATQNMTPAMTATIRADLNADNLEAALDAGVDNAFLLGKFKQLLRLKLAYKLSKFDGAFGAPDDPAYSLQRNSIKQEALDVLDQ